MDLGTEFAINSRPLLSDECHVFKGEVRVSALKVYKDSSTVKAGEAVKVNLAGRIKSIKINELAFLKSLPTGPLHLHWSFDSVDDGNFTTESSYQNLSEYLA